MRYLSKYNSSVSVLSKKNEVIGIKLSNYKALFIILLSTKIISSNVLFLIIDKSLINPESV